MKLQYNRKDSIPIRHFMLPSKPTSIWNELHHLVKEFK